MKKHSIPVKFPFLVLSLCVFIVISRYFNVRFLNSFQFIVVNRFTQTMVDDC
jgi:hypothetical protein